MLQEGSESESELTRAMIHNHQLIKNRYPRSENTLEGSNPKKARDLSFPDLMKWMRLSEKCGMPRQRKTVVVNQIPGQIHLCNQTTN